MDRTEISTVLVLGAYGFAGRAVTRRLAATGRFTVIAAGRNRSKLEALRRSDDAAVSILPLDIDDPAALASALSTAQLVVNCVGPYIGSGSRVARAAVNAGIGYLDLASEQEHYRRLQSLDAECRQARVPVLTGLGAYPGLSGILLMALLRRHPDAESATMALVSGPDSDSSTGAAQAASGIIELAYEHAELVDGGLLRMRPGESRDACFPAPFGTVTVMRWPQMEILAAASAGALRNFSTFVALGGHRPPPAIALRLLSWLRPTPKSRILKVCKSTLARRPTPDKASESTDQGAIVIALNEHGASISVSVVAKDLAAATSWLPVRAILMLADGLDVAGVATPMTAFNPDDVLEDAQAESDTFVIDGL